MAQIAEESSVPLDGTRTSNSVMATSLIGAHGLEHLYGHSFAVLVTAIYDDLGLVPFQAGLLSFVRQISSGLTSMGSGFFVDMFQHRSAQVLALSMAMIGLGYLLVALSPTYTLIVASLFIASAGSALWHPPALGLLSRRFPQRRGLFISLHRSTGNVGDFVGPFIAGALLAGGIFAWRWGALDWRWIMGGGTPLLFLLAVLVLITLWNVSGPKVETAPFKSNLAVQFKSLREAFEGRGMWAIFTVSALRGMGDRSFIFFLPLYLRVELDMSFIAIALHVALVAAPGIVSGPLLGALSDRIGRRPVITFVMATAVVLPVTLVMGGAGLGMTLSVVLFGVFHSAVNSLTQAAAIDEAAGRGLDATFIGLMWGSNAFFSAGAAIIAGLLVGFYGWPVAFYFSAGLFFVGFMASLLMPKTGHLQLSPA